MLGRVLQRGDKEPMPIMKTRFVSVSALFALLFDVSISSVAPAYAQQQQIVERPGITVQGSGSVNVRPDVGYLSLGVSAVRRESQAAITENARITNYVIAAIRAQNIAEKDIQTSEYSIEASYTQKQIIRNGATTTESLFRGYNVRNVVRVTVRDLENVGKIIDAAGKSGANARFDLSFGLRKDEKPRDEALRDAIGDAQRKANAVAKTLGREIELVSLVEGDGSGLEYNSSGGAGFSGYARSSTPVQSGELTIRASVTMRYALLAVTTKLAPAK